MIAVATLIRKVRVESQRPSKASVQPLPQEVHLVIGGQVTQRHTINIPTREGRNRLLARRLLIHVLCGASRFERRLGEQWNAETGTKLHAVKATVQSWPLMNRKADTILTWLRVRHTRFTHHHLLLGEQEPMCS
ncbi:hypothetical protein AVEN_129451-1 [Araneus ventricosus]|uniref:Uncharacterized protein n=1 Tax=Araneus ventricosus TaxID=182803 RepID=A0A4Y2LW43_ARAVE|nr:hypothetical protein AVEN_129451-1 [Araneus ventricosus]